MKFIQPNPFRYKLLLWLISCGVFFSCIQGPWDYEPEDEIIYRGVFLTGYVIGGRPVKDLCIERMYSLDELSTDAFHFYENYTLTLEGNFSGSNSEINFTEHPSRTNCFVGPDNILPLPGEQYELSGSVTWDSAGSRVTTSFTASANVPEFFVISDTARAPGFAIAGALSLDIGDTTAAQSLQDFFELLPPEGQEALTDAYGDTLTVLALNNNSEGLNEFMLTNGREIVDLISQYNVTYENGDSIFYMTGITNTMSHYYSSSRSEDVGTVLISHMWDTLAAKPETAFDSIFGFTPDTSDFYTIGNISRLLSYPNAQGGDGWAILDSMGFVNTWFYTGLNRIYFYGLEDDYFDYTENSIQNENNAKVPPFYNVEGAAGIFVGGLVDSFDVHIKVDSATTIYSLERAKALYCGSDEWGGFGQEEASSQIGWEGSSYCRELYSSYCLDVNWEDEHCIRDFLKVNIDSSLDTDHLKDSLEIKEKDFEEIIEQATMEHCIENNFLPEDRCLSIEKECAQVDNLDRTNEPLNYLWNWCEDNRWLVENNLPSEQCVLGLITFCRDNTVTSEFLCSKADEFCDTNPDHEACDLQ